MSLKTKIITDLKAWEKLPGWQELFEASQTEAFFEHPQYQIAWWQHLGRGELQVIAFYDQKQLVGLAPLFLELVGNQKILRLVGAMDESDYLDILALPSHEHAVYESLLQVLKTQLTSWDEIWLESLKHCSPSCDEFETMVKAQGWNIQRQQQTVSPVIALPTAWDEYLKQLPSQQQKNFTRALKQVGAEDEVSYRLIDAPEAAPSAMQTFIELHKASGTDKASFWNPSREAFFIELATRLTASGHLKMYFLDVDDDPAAAMIIFDFQNEFLAYNSGFNAYRYGHLGVGTVIVLHTIQAAIQLGRGWYDFMRGNESYKYTFGAVDEPVWDLKIKRN